ncbi:MAG: NERD domain-containing protein [Pseudomonadota bacterium]|nr:NERD domain-containing protein [Pseudomonadota bacterium]
MAVMLPGVALEDIEHGSERPVYRALRDQLPSDYTVLHSYPWLRRHGNKPEKPLREGEADFVVLHPERGMLVLEVKGGNELVLRDGTWYRRSQKGLQEKIKDPFEQARKNMHNLMGLLVDRSGIDKRGWELTYGYAVVFPGFNYTGTPPANADRAMIIGQRDMAQMKATIERAFDAWTDEPEPVPHGQYRLIQSILLPEFNLVRALGPGLDIASQKLMELTEAQQAAFRGLHANRRVLVTGAAGSGKTVLALQRALDYARQSSRCLFVCYNRELASWLRERVERDPLHADLPGQIDIRHFHGLARDLVIRANMRFDPPTGTGGETFWNDEAPAMLEQAVTVLQKNGENCRYDAIVVDEAQDFSEMWWFTLTESFLDDPDNGPLYVFTDPNQDLRGTGGLPPIRLPFTYSLQHNCRNTRKIAIASADLISASIEVLSGSPEGELPTVCNALTAKKQQDEVQKQLLRLLKDEQLAPDRIVLIGPNRPDRGSLGGLKKVAGVELITSAADWRAGKGVLITTTRSFKGLEADVVILYDLGDLDGYFTRLDLYVACTRARLLLIVVARDDTTREMIEQVIKKISLQIA